MALQILKVIVLFLIVNKIQGYPFEFLKLRPLVMSAPLSQIQWNNRGDWQKDIHVIDMEPRSYQMQKTKYNDVISTIKHQVDLNTDDDEKKLEPNFPEYQYYYIEDQMMIPSLVRFSVSHFENRVKKKLDTPKSLEISYQPTIGDSLSKLKIKDTLLDAVQIITTEAPKKVSPTRPRRPFPTTKHPKPKDKPQPRPNKIFVTKQASDIEVSENTSEESVNAISSPAPILPVRPQNNHLAGHSQIGNRESQMVIKPTVIVNIRGTVSNTDSDIKVESRMEEDEGNKTDPTNTPQNVFNINQEVNIEKNYYTSSESSENTSPKKNKKPFFDQKTFEHFQGKSLKHTEVVLKDNIQTQYLLNITNSKDISDFQYDSDDDVTENFIEIMKMRKENPDKTKYDLKPITIDIISTATESILEETTIENEEIESIVFESGPIGGFLTL